MILNLITELRIVGVFDRGIPNQERIVLSVNEAVNLGQYGLMVGVRGSNGFAFPIRDNLLWFGDATVKKGDWIFVYTGPGEAKGSTLPNTQYNLYSVHWGRQYTMLGDSNVVPLLIRVDAVQVLSENVSPPLLK